MCLQASEKWSPSRLLVASPETFFSVQAVHDLKGLFSLRTGVTASPARPRSEPRAAKVSCKPRHSPPHEFPQLACKLTRAPGITASKASRAGHVRRYRKMHFSLNGHLARKPPKTQLCTSTSLPNPPVKSCSVSWLKTLSPFALSVKWPKAWPLPCRCRQTGPSPLASFSTWLG